MRVQVYQDEAGKVWAAYQDWTWVAARYGIADRSDEFLTATSVVASIMSAIAGCEQVQDCTE